MENFFIDIYSKKNPSRFLVEQRVKSNLQPAKSNKQQAKINNQGTKTKEQWATVTTLHLMLEKRKELMREF